MFFSDGLALLLFTLKQINFHRRTISLFHKTLRLFVHYYLISSSNSVQSLSQVRLCDPMDCSTPGLPVHHQLPEFTQTHVQSVIPSSHLILCRPLLLLPPIPPSIRVFSNESTLHMRWPKYCFSIIPFLVPSIEKNLGLWYRL